MKFCPHCGRGLTGSELGGRQRHVHQPEVRSKKMNWSERHPGWTLVLVIICSPFVLWGIVFALIALAFLFPPSTGEAFVRGAISAMPVVYIAVVIVVVRWYRAKRRQSKTVANYGKAIELNPGDAEAYLNRGDAYGEIAEYDKAIADYSRAIELDPTDARPYYNRGLDYLNKGDAPKAVSDLEKCIALSTDPAITKEAQRTLYEIENSPRK